MGKSYIYRIIIEPDDDRFYAEIPALPGCYSWGYTYEEALRSHHIYQHSNGRRVLLVYHNLSETFGPKAIRQILQSTGWTEADLRRLGLLP